MRKLIFLLTNPSKLMEQTGKDKGADNSRLRQEDTLVNQGEFTELTI